MTPTEQAAVGSATWADCLTFYHQEALLLQRRRFRDWLALFEPEVTYVVPAVESVSLAGGIEHRATPLAYYEEDFETLGVRVRKLASSSSWSEVPASRNRYFVQLLEVGISDGNRLTATTNLLLFQYRDTFEQWFTGERADDLVRRPDGSLGVVRREVMLDRPYLGNQGLSVFF